MLSDRLLSISHSLMMEMVLMVNMQTPMAATIMLVVIAQTIDACKLLVSSLGSRPSLESRL